VSHNQRNELMNSCKATPPNDRMAIG